MKIKVLLAFLLIATSLYGQPGLGFSQLEYNGNVKSVLEEKFRAVFKNDSLVGYEYELYGSKKLFFDTLNRVKTKYDFKPARYVDTLEVKKDWSYFYSEGKLDSIFEETKYRKKHYYYYRNDSIIFIHKPNSRNGLKEIIATNFVDTIRHYRHVSMKYPRTGFLEQDLISKSLVFTEIHQKDNIGRIEKSLFYNYDTLKRIEVYTYDKISRHPIREHAFYLPGGSWTNSRNYVVDYKYELNEYGNVIERNYLDVNDGFKVGNTYTYQYDDYKNWVVRETFIEGKLKKVDKRTFEYY